MSCASSSAAPGGAFQSGSGFPRRGWEIAGIIFAFFWFWPVAIGYLVWKMIGYPMPAEMRERVEKAFSRGSASFAFRDAGRFSRGGNHAFEEYRRSELKRFDEERRRLDDEARAFADFVDELKRAKDRDEFDAFMTKRRGTGTTSV